MKIFESINFQKFFDTLFSNIKYFSSFIHETIVDYFLKYLMYVYCIMLLEVLTNFLVHIKDDSKYF